MKKSFAQLVFLIAVLTGVFYFTSCKKTLDEPAPVPPVNTVDELSDADSLKYLMYRIMQVSFVDGGRDSIFDLPTYLWYSYVPKLDPLSSSSDSADVLLGKMKSYPINPANGKKFDKYSFLDHGEVSGEIQGGAGTDIGMQVTYAYDKDDNIVLVVLYTDKNSPAGKAGITRGWQITGINGQNVTYDNGPNVQRVVNAVYYDPQATFTLKQPDGTTVTKTLVKASYALNPVLFDSVYSVAGKRVGYFVFNTFSALYNGNAPSVTKQELDRVFSRFQSENITSLIVDFRYNGGGSVSTAEYLDSLIAPASVAGKTMYQYLYNNKLTARANEIGLEKTVNFKGGGSLQLDNVFFIGSENTASASELTLNNLKPYMNVKLIGDTTYGKPVGFFTFTITDFDAQGREKFLADLYAINFETRNANNEGGYYNGLIPDALANDYVGIAWGSPNDDHLNKIFNYLRTGNYGRHTPGFRDAKSKEVKIPLRTTLKPMRFNGMVDYRVSDQIGKQLNHR